MLKWSKTQSPVKVDDGAGLEWTREEIFLADLELDANGVKDKIRFDNGLMTLEETELNQMLRNSERARLRIRMIQVGGL